jgi:hypothetical protein
MTAHLRPHERMAFRSAIYKRATYRAMIRDHNAGTCDLDSPHLNYCFDGILGTTSEARGILHCARARALGYTS